MKRSRVRSLSTTQVILLSFLLVILLGSVLLFLPISHQAGVHVSYIDALFTATSATCVTGLVTLPTVTTWSVFGQIVLLLLIQIGGLGVITIMAGVLLALHRKMQYRDSRLLGDAFNLTSLSGMREFVLRVIVGALTVEGIGALLCLPVFLPDFGARGIWVSVFHSVSAFCNAGIDIISAQSLCAYADQPWLTAVTGVLIVLGGLGFIVWWDLLRVWKQYRGRRAMRHLTLHSKIVLSATAVLILGGALLLLVLEYRNPLTVGDASLWQKVQFSLFQSITTRTAGFATVPQENLTDASALVCLLLMFVGGSPVGTAGGVKTVTLVVLLATAYATVRGRDEVSLFHRTLSRTATRKAVAVVATSFAVVLCATLLLSATTDASALDVLYETVSAGATVGLSRNLTPFLGGFGKAVITVTMYLGRIGPITLATIFWSGHESENAIKNPVEEISVG